MQYAYLVLPVFVLALIALLRCRREDLPEVVRALSSWWRIWSWP